MTNIEKFNADAAYNANNILFTMTDDEEMGRREKGFYVKDIIEAHHACRKYIFDNGHQYVHDLEAQILYVRDTISKEYFIHKYLEKVVSDFINDWSIDVTYFYTAENEVDAKSLIRLLPYREEKVVKLTNIMIPNELKHKGLGKLLIKQIFEVCQRLTYRLVLVDVVESFSNSLKKRNAKFLNFDTIEITNKTILT
ncbi:MAG: hypothetical protein IM591_12990 [Chitinophagaceae bacterium]|nr:hypothetical protein [Chitinophagaceae bacterium]